MEFILGVIVGAATVYFFRPQITRWLNQRIDNGNDHSNDTKKGGD